MRSQTFSAQRADFNEPSESSVRRVGGFCGDLAQGLLSGLVFVVGALQMGAEELAAGLPSLSGESSFVDQVFQGQTVGLAQIIVAVLLFLHLKRGAARMLGLLAVIGYVAMHGAETTGSEMLLRVSNAVMHFSDFVQTFGAPVAG